MTRPLPAGNGPSSIMCTATNGSHRNRIDANPVLAFRRKRKYEVAAELVSCMGYTYCTLDTCMLRRPLALCLVERHSWGRALPGNRPRHNYTLDMPSSSFALWKKPFSSSVGVSPCLANSMGSTISHSSGLFMLQTLASGISSKLLLHAREEVKTKQSQKSTDIYVLVYMHARKRRGRSLKRTSQDQQTPRQTDRSVNHQIDWLTRLVGFTGRYATRT